MSDPDVSRARLSLPEPTGALSRYRRQHQTGGRLTAILLVGTVPGVIAGSTIRVVLLPGARVFEAVIPVVLIPLSGWLLLSRESPGSVDPHPGPLSGPLLAAVAAAVGCLGVALGAGGVSGSCVGARLQPHLPELLIRQLLGLLVLAVGVRYAWLGAR